MTKNKIERPRKVLACSKTCKNFEVKRIRPKSTLNSINETIVWERDKWIELKAETESRFWSLEYDVKELKKNKDKLWDVGFNKWLWKWGFITTWFIFILIGLTVKAKAGGC